MLENIEKDEKIGLEMSFIFRKTREKNKVRLRSVVLNFLIKKTCNEPVFVLSLKLIGSHLIPSPW